MTLFHKAQICIVTPDLLGPVRNGGVGTACTFLAEALAGAGHAVSILFTQCSTTARSGDAWMARYRVRGIDVVIADAWQPQRKVKVFPAHAPLAMAHRVYNWLAERHFDLVFCMEWQGSGFYALQAKRAGLCFRDTVFVTVIHSPSLWHAVNNVDLPPDQLTALTYFMERKSVEWADAVISPSAYMLDWVRRYDFRPPRRAFVLPNLIDGIEVPEPSSTTQCLEEIVFFGRLEYRKGLIQFCDALDRIAGLGIVPDKVSFLGKFSRIGQEHSGAYIARRAAKWTFPTEIHARMDQAQALAYLQQPGRLAVIPSVADNSPYTVYECLVAGVPFLARDVGGVAELIDRRDQSACLFGDNPNALANLFAEVLREGVRLPRLAFDLEENRQAWRRLLGRLLKICKPARRVKMLTPKVSVCLTHYNRPKLLHQVVDSLLAQDYPNFEVILVDDGSPSKAARVMLDELEPVFAERGWRIARLRNGYLGRARNSAVRLSKGEFVLFIDDDNVARPNMISLFMHAAVSSGADLVTAVFDVFSGERAPTSLTPVIERFLPVGDIVSFSVVANAIGDANALIRRSVFKRLGGFSEDYGLGHEDFELYLRAVLAGVKVCVVPEPLFWYRRNGASMLSATHAAANHMRSFRPFMDALPAPLAELAILAYACVQGNRVIALTTWSESAVLSTEDQQRLRAGDPDATETVVLLAKVLVQQGQSTLAKQLLADLSNRVGSTEVSRDDATCRLLAAANSGEIEAVQAVLKAFGRTKTARVLAADACELVLASMDVSTTPPAVLAALARGMAVGQPESIAGQLCAAVAYAHASKSEEALKCFSQALLFADATYLKQRPDVAAAVSRNELPNGLTHFFRHGQKEGAVWAERIRFEQVSRNLLSMYPLDADVWASQDWQAMAQAMEVFAGAA